MAILDITKKIIQEQCKQKKQIDFQNTLIKFLEHLSEGGRTEQDLVDFAESLINSYKKEINHQEEIFNED